MPRVIDEWLGYANYVETKGSTGKKTIHNKWWAACILEEDNGTTYTVHTLFSALGRSGAQEFIYRFTKGGSPFTLAEATAKFQAELREKQQKKHYEQRTFGTAFGTPTPIIVPSFTLRFASASSPLGGLPSAAQAPTTVQTSARMCSNCAAAIPAQEAFCSNCGMAVSSMGSVSVQSVASASAAPTPHSQSTLGVGAVLRQGRYTIEKLLGTGGMGAVYRACDRDIAQRVVAVKELIAVPNLTAQEQHDADESFRQEATLLAMLHHPSLPHIYDHFSEQGRLYLVMDFIAGKTLEGLLAEAPNGLLPVNNVLAIALAIVDVLDYLHTQHPPIIFRDIKPANVMLTPRADVYLIDLGIARFFKAGQQKDTTALGSHGYAAPEQYGQRQSTPATDLYGLGATLHTALTGIDPSSTSIPFTFTPLPAWLGPLAGLNELIQAMVHVDAGKRPQSAAWVKAELRRIAAAVFTSQP